MRGSHLAHAKFSLQYLKFSLRYTMRNMFGMFSLVFFVIRALKCEVVNFLKFKSAVHRPFIFLGVPILLIACAPCLHMHDAHAHHDINRFAYDVSHITMTSPVFVFHSCHVRMRWHAVIGVCVGGTLHHHGSHCIGMT